MLKAIVVLAATLVSTAASAQNICYYIDNPTKCNWSAYCTWDWADARCEPLGAGGYCGKFFTAASCNAQGYCVWDVGDARCEPLP